MQGPVIHSVLRSPLSFRQKVNGNNVLPYIAFLTYSSGISIPRQQSIGLSPQHVFKSHSDHLQEEDQTKQTNKPIFPSLELIGYYNELSKQLNGIGLCHYSLTYHFKFSLNFHKRPIIFRTLHMLPIFRNYYLLNVYDSKIARKD